MAISARSVRAQMNILKPLLQSCSIETLRKGQNKLGELMEFRHRREVIIKPHPFPLCVGAWVLPNDERRRGVILYLHGGGYVCGDLEYAKGFASTLAAECGVRVFCVGYRLAPEHPYPAALEDALCAYRYLLDKGYAPQRIALCGESAGGGLCYALCMKLRELSLPQPGSVTAISPWTDLTACSDSYELNKEVDPSISIGTLDYYANCYCTDRRDPYVSPLFGDLTDLPPSLIFVGGDEIMRGDAQQMHRRLLDAGRKSTLIVREARWHAYLLYGLKEDRQDMDALNRFLSAHLSPEDKLRWMRLDNAAKIYPAARSQNWSNVFRLSVTLTEDVDLPVLQSALDVTVRRFPSIAARLRRGAFWYYIQQVREAPRIREEHSFPLARMTAEEMRRCALRVIVYRSRIAVELFHALTDGTGALIFLKSLTAEYLQQKYGVRIPAEQGVLGRLESPCKEELEDSFLKYAAEVSASRKAPTAWRIGGTPEPDGFRHVTCLQLPVEQVLATAHAHGVSLTAFLCAAMMLAIQNLQRERVPNIRRRRHIRVLIPVNLRKLFPSRTLRNFALYTTPEIDPRLGEYTFEELCAIVRGQMELEINPKFMGSMIAANVNSERSPVVRAMPLFIKNPVMKMVFHTVGERKSCLCLSNLGAVDLPPEMRPYVARLDFIPGVQARAPYNCGVLSWGGTLYVNFIRNITEPALEYHFHCVLRDLGIPVLAESNSATR